MSEVSKAVGQWIVANLGWTIIIILFLLSSLFKIAKKEVDPLGAVISWIGRAFTKDVRTDISNLKTETTSQITDLKSETTKQIEKLKTDTNSKFEEVKKDRQNAVESLKKDYNDQIAELRADLDGFEATTNKSICEMQNGTSISCDDLKKRLDDMERSNDMQTIRQIKTHVLNFANSCMNGTKHTFRDFRNIIKENKQYEELVAKYELKNDVYKDDFEFIMEIYHDCKLNRSFLNDNGKPFDESDE